MKTSKGNSNWFGGWTQKRRNNWEICWFFFSGGTFAPHVASKFLIIPLLVPKLCLWDWTMWSACFVVRHFPDCGLSSVDIDFDGGENDAEQNKMIKRFLNYYIGNYVIVYFLILSILEVIIVVDFS